LSTVGGETVTAKVPVAFSVTSAPTTKPVAPLVAEIVFDCDV
jgi:hypothetical protein